MNYIDSSEIKTTQNLNPDDILNKYSSQRNGRFWNEIFSRAEELSASDIHIEPLKNTIRVRYRVNTVLVYHHEDTQQSEITSSVISGYIRVLKELSSLKLEVKDQAQDASFYLSKYKCKYRVAMSPSLNYGERIVMRIIRDSYVPKLEDLGLGTNEFNDLKTALTQKQGLILVTGPTGSGKSTTLQACIRELDIDSLNVISIEDPIERTIPGVCYEQISSTFTWKDSIKTAMRQDPDIILIGEIRDNQSAQLAVEAALTGHLVMSTLHTNDVPSTIERFVSLGVDRDVLADSLLYVSAQRLAGLLCDNCKINYKESLYEKNSVGCNECKGTGYTGAKAYLEYCLRPTRESILNFNSDNFKKQLKQNLEAEKEKLISAGLISYK